MFGHNVTEGRADVSGRKTGYSYFAANRGRTGIPKKGRVNILRKTGSAGSFEEEGGAGLCRKKRGIDFLKTEGDGCAWISPAAYILL